MIAKLERPPRTSPLNKDPKQESHTQWEQQQTIKQQQDHCLEYADTQFSLPTWKLFMLFCRLLIFLYLTTKEAWHILCVNFFVVDKYTLVFPLRKVEQR